jgi:hypothetical protein
VLGLGGGEKESSNEEGTQHEQKNTD